MRYRLPVCLVIASWLATSLWAADANEKYGSWTQWRGPRGENRASDKNLSFQWTDAKPKLLWNVEGMGGGYASVSIQNGKIFTVGNFDNGQQVLALNAADGQPVWKTRITEKPPEHGYEGSRCTPAIDGDHLYAIALSGKVFGLKIFEGSLVWERDVV